MGPRVTAWELSRHPGEVGMARLPGHAGVPRWATDDTYEAPITSITRTAEELCVICAWDAVPGTVTAIGPFVAFSIDGPLDHALIGVLATLLSPLAEAVVSILATSTYDTDWILVATDQADRAAEVWRAGGHAVEDLQGDA